MLFLNPHKQTNVLNSFYSLFDEDSMSLKCEVDANPEAEITWRKEGDRRVLGNFPVLDIGRVE